MVGAEKEFLGDEGLEHGEEGVKGTKTGGVYDVNNGNAKQNSTEGDGYGGRRNDDRGIG